MTTVPPRPRGPSRDECKGLQVDSQHFRLALPGGVSPIRDLVPLLFVSSAVVWALLWSRGEEHSALVQSVCAATAVIWVISRRSPESTSGSQRGHIRAAMWVIAGAVLLRLLLLHFLPPPNQTGFEELQTGGIAYRISRDHVLPLEFRFTNLAASAGFLLGGERLRALRAPFVVFGLMTLALLVATLRRLGAGWPATVATSLIAASLRWLVIANVADELFASVWIAAAIAWCLVLAEEKPDESERWAALAGMFSGMLMFEYTSYRVFILLATAWLTFRLFHPGPNLTKPRLPALASFLVAAAAVSAPMLADILHHPNDTIFFEAFRRHGGERTSVLSAAALEHIRDYAKALAGGLSPASLYLTQPDEPAIPPLVGILFMGALLSAATCRKQRILQAFAATTALAVLAAALTANNVEPGRLSPLLFLILVLLGVFFDRLGRAPEMVLAAIRASRSRGLSIRSPRWPGDLAGATSTGSAPTSGWPRLLSWSFVVPIAVVVSGLNTASIIKMASDKAVLGQYCSDDYATAYWLGREAHQGQDIVLITPDSGGGWLTDTDMIWLYGPKHVAIHGYGTWPPPDVIPAGALVVLGVRGRSLSNVELGQMGRLAALLGAPEALRLHDNAAQNRSVAIFEVPTARPGGRDSAKRP